VSQAHEKVEPNRVVRCPHCGRPLFSVDATGTRILVRCGGCSVDHHVMVVPAQLGFVRGSPPR
jgi:transcription elongation factor Elf1